MMGLGDVDLGQPEKKAAPIELDQDDDLKETGTLDSFQQQSFDNVQ